MQMAASRRGTLAAASAAARSGLSAPLTSVVSAPCRSVILSAASNCRKASAVASGAPPAAI